MIDHSVYPDCDSPPQEFRSIEERADYLHRICAAWDFGIVPERSAFAQFAEWKEVFDNFPLPHSPAYHTFRRWFNWPALPGSCMEADYERFDAIEGRKDPCAHLV